MSRKLKNIFRKKSNKADSHGTTAANEELEFQAVPPQREQPVLLSRVQSNNKQAHAPSMQSYGENAADNYPNPVQDIHREKSSRNSKKGIRDTDKRPTNAGNKENFSESWMSERFQSLTMKSRDSEETEETDSTDTSSGERTTMKQSGSQKLGLLEPPKDYISQSKDVSISDEYSDPFDALQEKALARRNKNVDGYTEPFKAQRMHFEVSQGSLDEPGCRVSGNYHDPWDNKKQENQTDYEDPWDTNKQATLPYPTRKAQDGGPPYDVERSQLHRKLHNGKPLNDSLSSVASSASSASPSTAARRLVRVENPRTSPRSSPHFDRRLILPKDATSQNNYSEPWGTKVPKYKQIDKRLIKAEPSLEELRRMSPSGNSSVGTASPLSSGRGSPDLGQRRSPCTNSNNNLGGLPLHLLNMRSKSKSLDMRNNQALLALSQHHRLGSNNMIPKSVSDDHLTAMSSCHFDNTSVQRQPVSEYEEPWDKQPNQQQNAFSNNYISHSRSRSYESHGSPLVRRSSYQPNPRLRMDHTVQEDASFYETPWDKGPANHMQSMQRYQQRKLELHPTEAINTRDFDPLLPLEDQSWYHSGITRDEAEARLCDKLEGSFLVRKSESTRDSYSLSVQSSKGCIHMLLRCTRENSWILGEFSAPFLSAPEMVAFYTRNKLKISDSDYVLLSYPVADSLV